MNEFSIINPPAIGAIVADVASGEGVVVSVLHQESATVQVIWLRGDGRPVTGRAESAKVVCLESAEL